MKTKIKNLLLIFVTYLCIYLLCSAVFIGLFHTPFLSSMKVLMYRGIVFIVLTGIVSGILMQLIRTYVLKSLFDIKDVILMFFLFCCVNTVLFTLIPVTVERSVSVFMLSYMEENEGKSFTEEEIQEAFIDIYVKDFGAFEKRFEEQLVTGSIDDNGDGTYTLTDEGRAIVKTFRIVAKWFNTDDRCVYPMENKGK